MEHAGRVEVRSATCIKHGSYESRSMIIFGRAMPWSRCPKCAAEDEAKAQAEREAKARDERLKSWRRRIGHSAIPERFQSRTLGDYVAVTPMQRRALEFATAYAADFGESREAGRCAVFAGKPGTGKTHLACAIGMQIMRTQGRTVLYATVQQAIRRVRDTWSRASQESESQAVAALTAPDLLILDEVGVQAGTESERAVIFDVLNKRYVDRKPYILISNLTAAGVAEHLGERIIDRIREDKGAIVTLDWPSHRGSQS